MAVSTSNTFTNAVQGIPGAGTDFNVFANDSKPKYPIGFRFTRSDGSEFVYSHFGAAAGTLSTGGLICGHDVQESCIDVVGSNILAVGSTNAISGERYSPGEKGSHYVQIIFSSVTKDLYAGGYFQTVDGDGKGYTYRIRGNTVSSAKTVGAANTLYLELYEPLQQTLSTIQTTSFRIVGSQYGNLESATAVAKGNFFVAGINTCSHGASSYGWVQTKGLCGVRSEATTVASGYMFTISLAEPGLASYNLGNCSSTSGQVRFQRPVLGSVVASALASTQDQLIAVNLNL